MSPPLRILSRRPLTTPVLEALSYSLYSPKTTVLNSTPTDLRRPLKTNFLKGLYEEVPVTVLPGPCRVRRTVLKVSGSGRRPSTPTSQRVPRGTTLFKVEMGIKGGDLQFRLPLGSNPTIFCPSATLFVCTQT